MPPETEVTGTHEPTFRFLRLVVHRQLFEQIARQTPAKGETRPRSLDSEIQIGARIGLDADANQAALRLDITILPNLKWQPYKIEVGVSGVFAGEGATTDQLVEFSKAVAPPILFPYVREMVHRMTMDGIGGPVKLDPINIQDMINRTPWTTEEASSESEGATAANEP